MAIKTSRASATTAAWPIPAPATPFLKSPTSKPTSFLPSMAKKKATCAEAFQFKGPDGTILFPARATGEPLQATPGRSQTGLRQNSTSGTRTEKSSLHRKMGTGKTAQYLPLRQRYVCGMCPNLQEMLGIAANAK